MFRRLVFPERTEKRSRDVGLVVVSYIRKRPFPAYGNSRSLYRETPVSYVGDRRFHPMGTLVPNKGNPRFIAGNNRFIVRIVDVSDRHRKNRSEILFLLIESWTHTCLFMEQFGKLGKVGNADFLGYLFNIHTG